MTIMLDTSALVALHTSGVARTITHDAIKGDADWCASALALTEAMSIIDRMSEQEFVRHDLEDAIRHTWDYVSIVPVDQRCLDEAAELRAGDGPLSVGAHPYRSCPQLLDG